MSEHLCLSEYNPTDNTYIYYWRQVAERQHKWFPQTVTWVVHRNAQRTMTGTDTHVCCVIPCEEECQVCGVTIRSQ